MSTRLLPLFTLCLGLVVVGALVTKRIEIPLTTLPAQQSVPSSSPTVSGVMTQSDEDYNLFISEAFGIQFRYPLDWFVQDTLQDHATLEISSMQPSAITPDNPSPVFISLVIRPTLESCGDCTVRDLGGVIYAERYTTEASSLIRTLMTTHHGKTYTYTIRLSSSALEYQEVTESLISSVQYR